MNFIDLFLLIILGIAAFRGLQKGLVHEVAGLAALILGILGAIHFSDLTASLLIENVNLEGKYLGLVAFALTFVGIVIAVHFIANLIDKLVKAVALGFVNRLLGFVFGLVKMAFILSILLVILNTIDRKAQFLPRDKIENSLLYKPVSDFAPMLFPFLKFENFGIPKPQWERKADKNEVEI